MLLTLLALTLSPQVQALPPPAANPPRSTPSPSKLPPAHPLPLAGEEAVVLGTLDRAFAALAARDVAALRAVFHPGGRATEVEARPGAATAIESRATADFLSALAQGSDRYEERISDPAVEIDGDIAMVWAPYVFRVNGKIDHCGTDHFDLVRVDGAWKILNITGTKRTTGCPA